MGESENTSMISGSIDRRSSSSMAPAGNVGEGLKLAMEAAKPALLEQRAAAAL